MTLVEVLVALSIVFIVFLGLSGAGLVVLNENIKNSQRDEAVSVAETAIQNVRNLPFASVVDNTAHEYKRIRGLTTDYTVQRTVAILDAENRQVTVDVDWKRLENGVWKPYSHRIVTIVRAR
jgi:type II secretory pathway pseudopilin PulG